MELAVRASNQNRPGGDREDEAEKEKPDLKQTQIQREAGSRQRLTPEERRRLRTNLKRHFFFERTIRTLTLYAPSLSNVQMNFNDLALRQRCS